MAARLSIRRRPLTLAFAAAGAVLGIVFLHPLMEAVYWLASHDRAVTTGGSLWQAIAGRLLSAFTPRMLPMTGLFAALGSLIGFGFSLPALKAGRAASPSGGPGLGLQALIDGGEGERTEFKASVRWDRQLQRVNRALEDAVARTIAGFLNGEGGTLLIGISDQGAVVGCEADFRTLRRPDRDGFQQFLMTLVQSRLGGQVCSQVHVGFGECQGLVICRVDLAPSPFPVYFADGASARYFIRTGNGTRELDVREALEHVAGRRGRVQPARPTAD